MSEHNGNSSSNAVRSISFIASHPHSETTEKDYKMRKSKDVAQKLRSKVEGLIKKYLGSHN